MTVLVDFLLHRDRRTPRMKLMQNNPEPEARDTGAVIAFPLFLYVGLLMVTIGFLG